MRLSIAHDVLVSNAVRAMSTGNHGRLVAITIFPSAVHPDFVHYEVWDLGGQQSWSSKQPVMPTHVGDFIQHVLAQFDIDASQLKWTPVQERSPDTPLDQGPERGQFVYFLTAGPFVKIGKASGSPGARIRELQTGCPYRIELAAHVAGGISEERALHRRFAAYRSHGEWFRFEGELEQYVSELARAQA